MRKSLDQPHRTLFSDKELLGRDAACARMWVTRAAASQRSISYDRLSRWFLSVEWDSGRTRSERCCLELQHMCGQSEESEQSAPSVTSDHPPQEETG
jgi:hypothetical protein